MKNKKRSINIIKEYLFLLENETCIDKEIELHNSIKKELHRISHFKNEPVDCVVWIKNETVYGNDYNPNSVAPPEMQLLTRSILLDGYTQPIVSFNENDRIEVVDGFHRNRVGKENDKIKERIHGYLPIVLINSDRQDKKDRIASTIRHNRARGKHDVMAMTTIINDLKKRNWSDKKIGKELGMEPDEVLRLGQIGGLAEAFKDEEFSMSWEVEDMNIMEFED